MNDYGHLEFIIPTNEWKDNGAWDETLRHGIEKIENAGYTPKCMTIKTMFPNWLFIKSGRGLGKIEVNCPVHIKVPGIKELEYWWSSFDGKTLDTLNFGGQYDPKILKRLIRTLTRNGLVLTDRWSLVVTFE